MKKIIATTAAPAAIGPYSQGIDGGSVVITSGQLPVDPATGAFAEGGIHEAIMAYEDVTFFEILAEELALRDLGEPTRENYEAILDRMERYMGEFEENGTDHITVELE